MTLAAVFALLAVLAGYFVNTDSVQVLMGHLAKDELASRTGTVLAPAAHALYEVEFKWLLVTLLATAAIIAFLRGTRYYAQEQAGIKARVQRSRWIDFGITGALMFEIVALMNGLQDAVALKLSIVSILVAAYLAWVYERENAVTNKPSRSIYGATLVLIVLPVVVLAATMASTYFYSDVRSAWYAYAAAAVVGLGLILTVRMLNSAKNRSSVGDYYFADRNYNILSAGTKVALAAVVITGLLK